MPVFSDEAKKDAKEKLSPIYSKSKHYNVVSYKEQTYQITLDNIATMYYASEV